MSALCYCTSPTTMGQLCTAHAHTLQQDLRGACATLRELDITITNQAKQGGNSGSGERSAFNLSASDAREDVVVVLRSAAHLATPQVRHRYDETPAHLVARALAGFEQLCRAPAVHTVAQDLADALSQAWRVMDRAPERVTYGTCPCGAQVSAPRGAVSTFCRACGEHLDLEDWAADMHDQALAAVVGMVGTPRQIVEVLAALGHAVSVKTVRTWAARGRLKQVPPGTAPIYRLVDVAELAGVCLDKIGGESHSGIDSVQV